MEYYSGWLLGSIVLRATGENIVVSRSLLRTYACVRTVSVMLNLLGRAYYG